jgi:hypothetical protein
MRAAASWGWGRKRAPTHSLSCPYSPVCWGGGGEVKTTDFKKWGHFLLKKSLLKSFRPFTFFEIPRFKKVRYSDHTHTLGWSNIGKKTSDFKNWGHFLLKKSLLKSFCSFTFFEISPLKKVRYPDHTTCLYCDILFLKNHRYHILFLAALIMRQIYAKIYWMSPGLLWGERHEHCNT